jgi:hypothetical protein
MSIEAVNWAFGQRGLKPATKLVLVFLADCHNRHTKRCDPSQDLLSNECEMSRSTVNVHLNHLEDGGFLRRIRRFNKRTNKQESTLYILGCDDEKPKSDENAVSGIRTRKMPKAVSGKGAIPCPEKGQSRVRTVGHEPEDNRKRTVRAENPAPFFTADERFAAKQVAEFIIGGGSVIPSAVTVRVRQCIQSDGLLSSEQIADNGLGCELVSIAKNGKV